MRAAVIMLLVFIIILASVLSAMFIKQSKRAKVFVTYNGWVNNSSYMTTHAVLDYDKKIQDNLDINRLTTLVQETTDRNYVKIIIVNFHRMEK